MSDGITVTILGDSGPFSKMGKSIGYLLEVAGKRFLVDCGSPLFVQVGGQGLKSIDGLIITHCHDDHKRWFSDLALFFKYSPGYGMPLPLITTAEVLAELHQAAAPALNISLSLDSTQVIDVAFDDFVALSLVGPEARYRITRHDEGDGRSRLGVVDAVGNEVGPDRAKVVTSRLSGRARLLVLDESSGRWVEPASFYAFADETFYTADQRPYGDPSGFAIEAINAPVWHGLPTFGLRVTHGQETLVFSSDTRHDIELWQTLTRPRQAARQGLSEQAFGAARVLHGDINDFIEQTWSERRYEEARVAFDGANTIHDVSAPNSVVHTDYDKLAQTSLDRTRTILTHSPDRMTSSWMLSHVEKSFRVVGDIFYEVVDGELRAIDADFFHKDGGRYFVLYRNEQGTFAVFERDGILDFGSADASGLGALVCRVDALEDVAGHYLPLLEAPNQCYRLRQDGRIERFETGPDGSTGTVVEDLRPSLGRGEDRSHTG